MSGMKNYFNHLLLVSFLIVSVLAFGFLIPTTPVEAQTTTISQFVEFLIVIGVIAPDKAEAARAVVTSLGQVNVSTSTISIATSSLPYIQVLRPNGGESWNIDSGVSYTITWGSTSQVPVNIALVPVKGPVCNLTSIPFMSINGNNIYNILLSKAQCYNNLLAGTSTPLTAGTYQVRVSYTAGSNVLASDDSNSTFKILPKAIPSLKLTYPNGSEKLIAGDSYSIRYTFKNTKENGLKISILDYNNYAVFSLWVYGSNGSYALKIPSSLNAGAYKIMIEMAATDGTKIDDTSDNFFWISDVQ